MKKNCTLREQDFTIHCIAWRLRQHETLCINGKLVKTFEKCTVRVCLLEKGPFRKLNFWPNLRPFPDWLPGRVQDPILSLSVAIVTLIKKKNVTFHECWKTNTCFYEQDIHDFYQLRDQLKETLCIFCN